MKRLLVLVGPALAFLLGTLAIAIVACSMAKATWKPEYALLPPEVRAWYQNAELTPAAKARLHFEKCCDHSDVVKTKFRVNRNNGEDEWEWLDNGEWKVVPPDIIHVGESAPNGEPTLFVWQGKPTCFYPGQGGI